MASLLTVRSPGKPSGRWYINGQRVSQAQYDQARTLGKTLDCFLTRIAKNGTVWHYAEAR